MRDASGVAQAVPTGNGTRVFDGEAMRAWIERSHTALAGIRDELDALNVFPVPDSDTGTNLYLTLSEGRAALADLPAGSSLGEVAQAVALGALIGARGNSGIILSQYLRAVGETFADQDEAEGGEWAWALDRAALAATGAMAEPVEGTALTVVAAASDAGRRAAYLARGSDDIPVERVIREATSAARDALARTPSLLAPLAERGVVDAGGAGFVVLLQALHEVLTGTSAGTELTLTAPAGVTAPAFGPTGIVDECLGHRRDGHDYEHFQAGDFEVMYVLKASERDADLLRQRLSRIGTSVGVVGGVAPGSKKGLWHVHVHTDEPLGAVREALGSRIRQVCVRYLRGERADPDGLGLVACTRAPGLIAPLARAGAVVVYIDPGDPRIRSGIARAVVDSGCNRVGILPCGPRTAAAAAEAVAKLKVEGSEIVAEVLESRGEAAVVAGVAGLAGAGDNESALSRVASEIARTRTGLVRWPNDGEPGVGAVELAEAALAAVRDLVGEDDEVLTVVVGREVPSEVLGAVAEAARAASPAIEVIEVDGGQVSPALSLGVE